MIHVLYILLFNLGLVAFLTPVRFDPLVRRLGWPFPVVVTLTAVLACSCWLLLLSLSSCMNERML